MRISILLLLAAIGAGFAQPDKATQYFEQAQGTPDLNAKIALLKQSLASGNSYSSQYALGEAYRKLSRYDEAETAFLDAMQLTKDEKELARSAFRLGQTAEGRGRIPDAIAWVTVSRKHYAYPESGEALKKLELGRLDKPQPAAEIVAALSSVSRSSKMIASVNVRIHFALNSADLSPDGRRQARELGNALRAPAFASRRFLLAGHTDQQGEDGFNLDLSKRRAKTVEQFLERETGIAKGRLKVEGRGKKEPLFTGKMDEDHRLNRRVEIILLP